MINKRLISLLSSSRRHIFSNVFFQWLALLANIVLISTLIFALDSLIKESSINYLIVGAIVLLCIILRHFLTVGASRASFKASKSVKTMLRDTIYRKMLRLGRSYTEQVPTAEAVQVASEGVEQLETYYGLFLPQLLYSMVAPLTLFVFFSFIYFKVAIVLLILVPLIPLAIVAVQRFAKKLLAKHWGQYAKLGDSFLENLQGLTTLKIYSADKKMAEKMAEESETFRKVTMGVLTMQLNSITVIDVIAYGGAALGIILSLLGYRTGDLSLWGCFVIILLSIDFFLPLRILASYFHTAMSGVAASERMFRILDLDEPAQGTKSVGSNYSMELKNLNFSYDNQRTVLKDISLKIPQGSFTAIVGESGSGKSTIASILTGNLRQYEGSAAIGGNELKDVAEKSLMEAVTYIGHESYLFSGTVKENLRLGNISADDASLWKVLEQVRIADFLRSQEGLQTKILARGLNLSGGQRQRLALARGLLNDSPVYIFDEATSNIDVESENDILSLIIELSKKKTVLLISHRLMNVVQAGLIYVLEDAKLISGGTHEDLLSSCKVYTKMWNTQHQLEKYGREGNEAK